MHGSRARRNPARYHQPVDRVTWRDRLRYRFDEFMGRGTIALIVGLFVISVLLIVIVAAIVWLTGFARDQQLDFADLLRYGLLRTLDPGTMGGDQGTAGFLLSMFTITLGGIFVISTLIGILNTGLEGKLAELRKGRSRVVEREHTVILGWSQQIHTVISEIVAANENQPRRSIVILADRDKVEMEDASRVDGPDEDRLPVRQPYGRRRPADPEPGCRAIDRHPRPGRRRTGRRRDQVDPGDHQPSRSPH